MFNFSDLDYSNENNTENVIDKQSREFLKKQKNILNHIIQILKSKKKDKNT
jgi:hypothetical protein